MKQFFLNSNDARRISCLAHETFTNYLEFCAWLASFGTKSCYLMITGSGQVYAESIVSLSR